MAWWLATKEVVQLTMNDKRERILKAGVNVFARRGFYSAKVSEIARAAGVADGTIYLYFRNKDEILLSIFEQEMSRFITVVENETGGEESGLDKIRKLVRVHLGFVKKNPDLAQVFQLELRQSNKFIKEYDGSKLKEYLDLIGKFIKQGQREGSLRTDLPPGLVKRSLFGALDEIATHWVLSGGRKYDIEQSADQIADIFISGVAVQPK